MPTCPLGLALLSSAQAGAGGPTGSGSRGCLPGGEEDHSKQLNFSLQSTDRFPEMLERGEGIGSKICRGTSLAFFNSAAELVNKVAGSQSLFLFLANSFFFFPSFLLSLLFSLHSETTVSTKHDLQTQRKPRFLNSIICYTIP